MSTNLAPHLRPAVAQPLLSSFYFGCVEHYLVLARHPHALLDTGEHYVRQSHRTRTRIAGPNGPQDLSVQILHDHGRKMPMHAVRLSHAEPWPQQHLHAIRSAYGSAPWFIHYIDDIEHLLLARHERLIDLNLASMRLGMRWLGLTTAVEVAERYAEPSADALDLRDSLHPKRPLPPGLPPLPTYPQVFAARHGFQARMSIIDLVCNTGPDAPALLLG